MRNKEQQLQQRARSSGTLLERLEQSRRRIASMCAERRGPRMTIPVEASDDDFFICLALEDAIAALSTSDTGHLKLDTDRQVFFYEQDHYYLSNFSAFRVQLAVPDHDFGGDRCIDFDTSEIAYHWFKFEGDGREYEGDHHVRGLILSARSSHDAFKIAEKWRDHRRPDWDAVKVGIMRDILWAKVGQHEYAYRKLMETGDRELIENSWRDTYWGWGPNRDGQNMLGKLWMEIRAELRSTKQTITHAKE